MNGNRKNYTLTIISLVISAATDVSLAFMLLYIFNAFTKINIAVNQGLTPNYDELIFAIISGVVFCVLYMVFKLLKRNYMNRYLKTALAQFKDYVFGKILNKTISDYAQEGSAKFLSAFSNDLSSIETNYLNGTLNIIGSMLTFVGSAIAMLVIQWELGLPMIIAAVVCLAISLVYGKQLVSKESKTAHENMTFIDQVKDLLNGFIVIKSFKAEKEVQEIFSKKNTELESSKQSRRVTSDTVTILTDIASLVINLVLFVTGFVLVMYGRIDTGVLMAFIQLANYMLTPVRQLGAGISNRRAAIALIERISDAIEREDTRALSEKTKLTGVSGGIDIEDLSFSYEEGKEALRGISLHFDSGKSYAIVGGSGCGKSTLLKLMMGFYPDYEGSLKINGHEMRDVSLDSLYDYVSVIQQDVFLFDSTIENNITMFSDFSKEEIQSAAERAGLASLIAEKGSDYSCGESGRNLSGGEKQRVSIARCLIRNTPVLLMDEATAALDSETAFSVTNEILDIDGLTRIIVTHGLEEALLRRYDEIVVIQSGRVAEQGHFDELMAKKGFFHSLYNVFQS